MLFVPTCILIMFYIIGGRWKCPLECQAICVCMCVHVWLRKMYLHENTIGFQGNRRGLLSVRFGEYFNCSFCIISVMHISTYYLLIMNTSLSLLYVLLTHSNAPCVIAVYSIPFFWIFAIKNKKILIHTRETIKRMHFVLRLRNKRVVLVGRPVFPVKCYVWCYNILLSQGGVLGFSWSARITQVCCCIITPETFPVENWYYKYIVL